MIIYKPNERVTVKIGDVKIKITPLMPSDRVVLADILQAGAKSANKDIVKAAYEALRLSVKEIDAPGYSFSDGQPISLSHGDDGRLTDESLAVLLQVIDAKKLTSMAIVMAGNGIREWEIEGVEIVDSNKSDDSQKKSQASAQQPSGST